MKNSLNIQDNDADTNGREGIENQLKTNILNAYLNFLQTEEYNVKNAFKNFLICRICTNSFQKNISLLTAIQSAGYNFDNLLDEVKKNICLYCGFGENGIEKNYYIKLPCECRFCKKECFQGFIDYHKKRSFNRMEKNNPNKIYYPLEFCPCGHKNEIIDFLEIIQNCEKLKENEASQNFTNVVKNKWKWTCMICKNNFNSTKNNVRILFKDSNIKLKIDNKDYMHLICEDCYKQSNLKEKQKIACSLCCSEHQCEKISKVNYENNESSACLIF